MFFINANVFMYEKLAKKQQLLVKLKIAIFYTRLKIFSRKKKPVRTHKISTRNKWLYPGDNFGKMECGVEYDEK